jgi:hypothetical protein
VEGLSVDDEARDALWVVGDDVGRPLLLARNVENKWWFNKQQFNKWRFNKWQFNKCWK